MNYPTGNSDSETHADHDETDLSEDGQTTSGGINEKVRKERRNAVSKTCHETIETLNYTVYKFSYEIDSIDNAPPFRKNL